MNALAMFTLLAQEVGPGDHFSLIKIGIFTVLFVGWLFTCQWVDRDADFVKTNREQWNMLVLAGGIAGLAVWLLVPWAGTGKFLLGLAFWLLLANGAAAAYIVHRNGRVVASARVMTPAHFKRVMAGGGKKKERVDRGQRVRMADSEGKDVNRPADPETAEQYAATQEFLFDVLWRRSTDADMVVTKDGVRLVYRVDGVAAEQRDRITLEDAERVILYLKHLAGLNAEERRRPQVGRIQAALLASEGDLGTVEVHASGSTAGERLRLRVVTSESLKRISDLGLTKSGLEQLKGLISLPGGLVVFSGAKHSGVTTTQYAVLREHDAFMQNLHTLEHAPLTDLDNITQNQHQGPSTDVGYARQLQSVLRREPNVVLIGECPDRETALIACRAAAADKKIYLALEAKGVFDVLEQLRQMVEDHALLSAALRGIVNQRLVRVLCPACRQTFKPDEKLLKKLNLPAGKVEHFHRPPTEPVLDRKGREIICQTCRGTGFVGRMGVFEFMVADKAVTKLLAEGAPVPRIRDYCRRAKMFDLRRAGLQKVYDGVTSLDEILRALRFDGK
ncbi:MAG TPA: ATPase, T2SS/T4P/T4SS family [Phycisphaerae bacterium]|nr:ATPase, T2SS/T4P/T4SS family [Phycisphaerae bacterium]